ncbi:MAG: hypothetical protein K2X47_04085, partial [Bdellovibrionales bacterium]|nr:hypothetical protein [Bdellovibrionales bacterium]
AVLSHVVCTLLTATMAQAATNSFEKDLLGYDRARLNAMAFPGNPVPREQWEAWVNNGDPMRGDFLRSSRMRELQDLHARLSYDNFQKARKLSRDLVKRGAPDLDRIRAMPENLRDLAIAKMCMSLPKGGLLHVHPNGTIAPEQALQILREGREPIGIKDIVVDKDRKLLELGFSPAEMAVAEQLLAYDQKPIASWPDDAVKILKGFMTLPEGPQPFARFDTVFPFVKLASKNVVMKHRIYREHALNVQKEGIQYIEYTTSLKIDLKTRTLLRSDADLLLSIADHVENTTGVIVRYNLSFLRTEPAADLKIKAEVTRDFLNDKENAKYRKYFVGIDLLGPEQKDSALDKGLPVYSVFLADSRRADGIKMTQHAGEHGDLRNPRDAMIMGANRLGHGTQLWFRKDRSAAAAESILAMEYARRNRILIETNLSSNLRLNAVKSYWEQPWIIMLRLGVPVALSTDNDGILGTSPSGECEIAIRESNITYAELKQMAFDSVTYSFASSDLKNKLTENLENQFKKYELDREWQRGLVVK